MASHGAGGEWLIKGSGFLTCYEKGMHRKGQPVQADLFFCQANAEPSDFNAPLPIIPRRRLGQTFTGWIATFLKARGLDPIVAYIGFHPDWQADLGLERDIPVLWLGKAATNRRGRLLKRIRAELKAGGIEILVIDGVENPYVFGKERTTLLNRTKIMLNLLRTKWDNNGVRYYLTAPNRALIVTEPTLDHTLFKSGQHLVEAPVEQIAATICYYLEHEQERQRIVEQAYQLVTTQLTMKAGISRILAKATAVGNEHYPTRFPV